jgi:hypothetical protein
VLPYKLLDRLLQKLVTGLTIGRAVGSIRGCAIGVAINMAVAIGGSFWFARRAHGCLLYVAVTAELEESIELYDFELRGKWRVGSKQWS